MNRAHPPFRVGLIGYGFAGRTFHAPLIGAVPGLELVAVASSDAARVLADLPQVQVAADPERFAAEADVDLLVIASPNATHAPLARIALAAGRHVVVDKPFTVDLAEARELAASARRSGCLLSVFQNRRWDSDFLSVRAALESGRVGEVVQFESHIDRFRPQVRDRWRERDVPGGGLWFDLGPHLVDQALCLFGVPERVSAVMARQRAGAQAVDWAHAVLDYGHRQAILHAGMLVAHAGPRFVVHGDRGSVVKRLPDRQEELLRAGRVPGADDWGRDPDPLQWWDGEGASGTLTASVGDQSRYYAAVRDALAGQGENPVPPQQAVATMAVVLAAAESARSGRAVAPRLDADERAAFD